MCTEEFHEKLEKELADIKELIVHAQKRACDPLTDSLLLTDTRDWQVDYRERKHIYLWSPTGVGLSIEDLGTFNLPAEEWTLFDMQPGTRVLAPAYTSSAPVFIFARYTDELLPEKTADIAGSGYVTFTSTTPTATTAGTATTFTFIHEINYVTLQNNGPVSINYDFNQSATSGSLILATGQTLFYNKKTTTVSILSASGTAVNGTGTGNIVLKGEI